MSGEDQREVGEGGGVKVSSSKSQVPHFFVLAVLGLWVMNGLGAGMFWKAAGPSVKIGQWSVYSDSNPLGEKTFEAVRLHAARGGNAWSGYPELWIKCEGGQTEMYIYWSNDLGPEPQAVSLQLDEQEPFRAVWPKSHEASATPYPGSAIPTIKMMMKADMVVAETTTRKGEIIRAEFATSRLNDAVERVRQSCKW